MIIIGVLSAHAGEYTFITFELNDGTKASVPVTSLTMTISGNTLKAGSETFVLTNLSKMYFTTTSETTTGIESIDNLSIDRLLSKDDEVYDLSGKRVLSGTSSNAKLKRGVYIIKSKEGISKIAVK